MPARKRTVSVPSLPKKLPFPVNTLSILVILIIVAAFLIGVLITKVSYLENGVGGTGTGNVATEEGDQPEAPTGPVDVAVGHLPFLGNEDAKVKIIEFSDFQCPFCKALFDQTLSQLKKEYVDTGKVAFYYRHYPLSSIHPNAQKSAEAAECANEQGNFWGYHDELFKTQADWESLTGSSLYDKFAELATNIGLNGATLKDCVESGKLEDKVKEDESDGSAAGVQGTPATFINGMLISGAVPYSEFKAEIERQLAN